MHRSLLRSPLILIVYIMMMPGCVKMLTGEYEIRRREVSSLLGAAGSGRPIEIGATDRSAVRNVLGVPRSRYEPGTTDIFVAVPRYRWIVNWWPVAIAGQSTSADPYLLLRIDYDANGVVARTGSTEISRSMVPRWQRYFMLQAWPDLAERQENQPKSQ